MATLDEKMLELGTKLGNLGHGIRKVQSRSPGPWTWEVTMKSVHEVELALKKVRAVIRANARKEKRDACDHPDRNRDVTGKCGKCGEPNLESLPAKLICICGYPRFHHGTDQRESLVRFHEGANCTGFNPKEPFQYVGSDWTHQDQKA
jgi:hypothetical protein